MNCASHFASIVALKYWIVVITSTFTSSPKVGNSATQHKKCLNKKYFIQFTKIRKSLKNPLNPKTSPYRELQHKILTNTIKLNYYNKNLIISLNSFYYHENQLNLNLIGFYIKITLNFYLFSFEGIHKYLHIAVMNCASHQCTIKWDYSIIVLLFYIYHNIFLFNYERN